MPDIMTRLVASPACVPQLTLDEVLPRYAALGFRHFEAFSSWAKSCLDVTANPAPYVSAAAKHGMRYTSMHLPPIKGGDAFDATLVAAVDAAAFAQNIGAGVVLYKADSRETYIRAAKPFLDALDQRAIRVTPVLQNHKGTPITTLDDYRQVIAGINDSRMKTLLEVGHFYRVGATWREGCDLLGDSIALVHINEIDAAGQSVPFGSGRTDFAGLFAHLKQVGYGGLIVVELELDNRNTDADRTFRELGNGIEHLRACGLEALS
jgi:sugar phosphate isomerase/epimerase